MDRTHTSHVALGANLPPHGCLSCRLISTCMPPSASDSERQSMNSLVAHRVRVVRGAHLFMAGDTFATFFVIRLGQIKTIESDHRGIEHVTRFCVPGASLGWDGMATGHFQMTAVALEDCEICVMPYQKVLEGFAEVPRLRELFMSMFSQRLIDVSRRALYSSCRFLDERLAAFIIEISEQQSRAGYSGASLTLRMSRTDICSYLGTSPEALSRLFATFSRNKWVRLQQRNLDILEPGQLRSLAKGLLER